MEKGKVLRLEGGFGAGTVDSGLGGRRLFLVPAEQGEEFLALPESDRSGVLSEFDGFGFYLSRVSKGALDAWIDGNTEKLALLSQRSGLPIFAGNIAQIRRLAAAAVPVIADYGMNAANSAAFAVMSELGASATVEALEYREDAMGLQPMMITEQTIGDSGAKLESAQLKKTGRAGAELLRAPLGDKTYILG